MKSALFLVGVVLIAGCKSEVGRYQYVKTEQASYLLDTATGKSYVECNPAPGKTAWCLFRDLER